jgi:anion-transporting  ArsA/GET3 family ATPase
VTVAVRELRFADRRLLVCVGSGGVGKTTVAASVALSAALEGRRVLVCTIDPARRLANSLGLHDLGNQEARVSDDKFAEAGLAPRGELFAMMLDLKTSWDDLIARYARSPEQREKIFGNRFYQQLSSALAGSREYIAVEKLYELATERDYDLIVLDTPPTVHALDFLDAPNRLLEFLDNQAARWLLTPALGAGKIGMQFFSLGGGYLLKSIGRFTGMETLRELAEFMLSLSGMYDGFKERAARVKELLASPETGFVLVTSPNALTVEEALHFHTLLVQEELHVSAVIANRVHPPPRADGTPIRPTDLQAALEQVSQPDLAARVVRAVTEAQLLWAKDQEQIQRLTAAGIRPLQVPWLDSEVQDLPALRDLAASLAAASEARG